MTAPREDGEGPRRAMQHALRHAGLKPSSVDYVNAHATSTPLGDAAENRAIKDVLLGEDGRTKASEVNVSSTKGAVGHLLGAAGSAEAIFTILGLHNVSPKIHQSVSVFISSGYSPANVEPSKPGRSVGGLQLQLCAKHRAAGKDQCRLIKQLWLWWYQRIALLY
jgi:acetyl-CoA acetyltransferase